MAPEDEAGEVTAEERRRLDEADRQPSHHRQANAYVRRLDLRREGLDAALQLASRQIERGHVGADRIRFAYPRNSGERERSIAVASGFANVLETYVATAATTPRR